MARFSAVLMLGAAALTACAPVARDRPGTASLTPVELIARAKSIEGQQVEVEGYFTAGVDTRALWQSQAAWRDAEHERRGDGFDYWSQCVTLYSADDRIHFRSNGNQRIRATGKVVIIGDDDLRSLWTCNRVSVEVTALKVL